MRDASCSSPSPPSLLLLPPIPSPLLRSFPPSPLEVDPHSPRGSGGAHKFPQRVRAEPSHRTFVHTNFGENKYVLQVYKLCPSSLRKSSFVCSNSSVGTQKVFLRLCALRSRDYVCFDINSISSVSEQGNKIGRVRPSIFCFPRYLLNKLTSGGLTLIFERVRGLKIKIISQSQELGLWLARMVTRSVSPRSSIEGSLSTCICCRRLRCYYYSILVRRDADIAAEAKNDELIIHPVCPAEG